MMKVLLKVKRFWLCIVILDGLVIVSISLVFIEEAE